MRLVDVGPAGTYQPGYFLDYPPGYLYALWTAGSLAHAIGASGDTLRLIVEAPALLADLVLAILIFAMIRRSELPPKLAWIGMILFALNPALLFDTLAWGQSDSIPALLMLLSMAMVLEDEYELGWGIAAMAALVKPQALMFLPVLGWWTLLRASITQWITSATVFLIVGVLLILPFQLGQSSWTWIFSLYGSTAAYYHETSVNAFNFMALVGGLRQADSMTVMGVSYFIIGMSLLSVLFLWIFYLIWRKQTPERLNLGILLALFGSFMFAPRMHERYLYPALVFLIPLVVETPILGVVLAAISVTFLVNLADVMHILEAKIFFSTHDPLAMVLSTINVIAFAALAAYAHEWEFLKRKISFGDAWRALRAGDAGPATREWQETKGLSEWASSDTVIIVALVAVAAAIRFWRLWYPNEIVFDEVHFVGQARHYLHNRQFLDPHPPLAKLLIALSIGLFGDHSWAWRLPNALAGTGLVAITYLLGRRMFASRFAAALAAAFALSDGLFLVDSRTAVLDIVYVTCAAESYLLLFRFMETSDLMKQRRTLLALAIVLGLCLSAKLYIPALTFLLVVGFLVWFLWRSRVLSGVGKHAGSLPDPLRNRHIIGALALTGGVGAMVYVGVFLPHYALGWWGGIEDLFAYYGKVAWYEKSVASATHPYSSTVLSWPLMLRPIAYWQDFPAKGNVATIWGGGNPAIWWGALTSVFIVASQWFERRSIVRAFIAIGYVGYLAIWVPNAIVGRTLFLYHYMPAIYLGFLALAMVLVQCWEGEAKLVEQAAMMLTLLPVFMLGLGPAIGAAGFIAIAVVWIELLRRTDYAGKWVCATFLSVSLVLFIYFFPVWTGMHIERAGYYARMWLQGSTFGNWSWI
jgi:predicted membrane-bound dolichyl-phosphate-mannose-protein mannosyltransferase